MNSVVSFIAPAKRYYPEWNRTSLAGHPQTGIFMPKAPKRAVFYPESLKQDLYDLEPTAREAIFQALQDVKLGVMPAIAKPHGEDDRLKGVMKIAKNAADGNTYRGIYTVQFEEAIWVIDVYAKKSVQGIATPRADIERAVGRLKSLRDYRTNDQSGRKQVADLLADLKAREAKAQRDTEKFSASNPRKPKRP